MIKALKVIAIVIVLLSGTVVVFLSRQIGGWRAFTVMSASMEPTIPTGSLIITHSTTPGDLKEGMIVTFIRPDNTKEFITHRIASIDKTTTIPIITTKGDNNNSTDSWRLVAGSVVGTVFFITPKLGYFLSLARTKIGIALLILIPSVLIIIDEIHSIISAVKHKEKPPITPTILSIFMICLFSLTYINVTQSLMSDSVLLTANSFSTNQIPSATNTPTQTLTPTPTVTSTPTPFIYLEQTGCSNTIVATASAQGGSAGIAVNNQVSCSSSQSAAVTSQTTSDE